MTILKTLAAASLMLLLVPAGQAFASTPHDLGSFQTQCMAQGGALGLGDDADTYECGYLDGNLQTCDFGGKRPSCVTISGPAPHRQDVADTGPTDPNVKWDHRIHVVQVCHAGAPGCP